MKKKGNVQIFPHPDYRNVLRTKIDSSFGIVSDMHMGSKFEAVRELRKMYQYFKKRGIKQVFNCGDITDGFNVYRGQVNELSKIGFDAQAKHVIKNYPKVKGIKTYLIAGNHDESYIKTQGADICRYISNQRPDIKYLGLFYARIKDGISLDLVHPSGGGAYAISYGAQKYLRNLPPSARPDIIVFGHRHQALYTYWQETHILEAGCFQKPTNYMIRRGYVGDLAGWIITLKKRGRRLVQIAPELILCENL